MAEDSHYYREGTHRIQCVPELLLMNLAVDEHEAGRQFRYLREREREFEWNKVLP